MAGSFLLRLEATARRHPGKRALAWSDGELTYGELAARADAYAAALRAGGVAPGARIATAMANRWTFPAALLAGWKLGATVAPLDPLLKRDERGAILADLSPALAVEEAQVEDAWRTRAAFPWDAPPGPPAASAPALVLYTSGSTGRPKGAVIGHPALAFAIESWAGPVMALTPEDVVLAALPLSHSFGLNGALLAPLLAGATAVFLERFTPEAALEAIACHRVTVLPAVATMFRRILDSPALAAADLGSLRVALSGAAPCPWPLADEWRRRTGIRILRGYGMTELFRPISYLASGPEDVPEAVGKPVPGVAVRIVAHDGSDVPAGEIGELRIKTPAAMDGYLGSPEETREAMTDDGWFRTGDLARLGDEGTVEIAGRLRERILRGGYSVFPQEVEAVLLAHPAVAEAAVVGAPHPELGEEVTAYVALRPDGRATPDALVAHCRERLAGFKYPRRITILTALPRSATGKILKARLGAAPGDP